MTTLLLEDRLAPVTSEIGFIEADAASVAKFFVEWQQGLGHAMALSAVTGSLEDMLAKLLPLTSAWRQRYLFIPTRSKWTAFFDNGHRGTDAVSVMSYLAREMRCRGMRVAAVPHTLQKATRRGRFGAVILEIYGPERTQFLNYIRSIAAVYDGGRWVFEANGDPQPFEDLAKYQAKNVRDRFTQEMLVQYLAALGVSPFAESFFAPEGMAYLVERSGPVPAAVQEYTLAEARSRF